MHKTIVIAVIMLGINTVKELLHTGGLRCEILSSGKICVDDQIIF